MPMPPRLVMHLDMNSYFASVEQQANPFLRGRPVGVCAYLSKRGCILASSIEAKAYGVKTGMRACDAKKLCPDIVLLENEPSKYKSTTTRIFSLFREYTDTIEAYSIDEAFLDFTGWMKTQEQVEKVASEIQHRIRTEVGEWLRCSIGISYTKFLSKFASDITDPDSILMINKDNLDEILKRRLLMDAWGINMRIAARLHKLGIHSLYDLKTYPVMNLMTVLGKYGYMLWAHVNGIDTGSINTKAHSDPKSIGHSYCLPKKTTDRSFLAPVLHKLCERTGRRLRNKNLIAKCISCNLGFTNASGFHKRYKLPEYIYTTSQIYDSACKLIKGNITGPVRFMAVSVSHLRPPNKQRSLWDDKKLHHVEMAVDAVNDKYGEYTIFPGSLSGMEKYAKERIGYRKSVEDF